MKIAFLIHNAYGIGGTIRATANLAGALAARHDVEIVSVYRGADTPQLPVSGKVKLTSLIDIRKDAAGCESDNELQQEPSALLPHPEGSVKAFTRLADLRVSQYLEATDADVVIATRPGLLVYLTECATDRDFLRIGQEHLIHGSHAPSIRAAQDRAIPLLDAHTTVSEADAATHREHFPDARTHIVALPNGVPAGAVEPSGSDSKLVVAAGRLIPVKRYSLLVEAFAKVAAERPDWSLRIYGRGPERAALRAQIDELGLNEHIQLMGPHSPIETEWAKGSIAAVTSDYESFGMTIVEAMHCGVPVVATDCPHGPGEIIDDGTDGLLVPVGDADGVAKGLLKLIEDDELRRAMGRAARESAQRYAPARIAERFEEIVRTLRPELLPPAPEPAAPAAKTAGPASSLRRTAARLVRPLRRKPAPVDPAPATAPTPAPLKALRPKASARATADGGLAVRLPRAGVTGEWLTLVGRLRGTDGTGAGERIVLPLAHPGYGKGPLTAVLDRAGTRLAEGRWDFHVERADDGKRARVAAALVEQARLLPLPLNTDGGQVSAWVPYTTAAGSLTLRTWLRTSHAELERIHVGEDSLTVTATLHGDAATLLDMDAATLVAVSPEDSAYDVELPVTVQDGHRLRCTLPYEQLLTRRGTARDVWQLRLRPVLGAPLVPLGRLAGDSVDRKRTDVHPARTLVHPERGPVAVRPVFDPENDLTLDVRDVTDATM
ncbi:glycosyltransferase family 4 protein [Streptomyces netropsis]|uniref:D-inositol 3-phosphate glycosyltransferase n=1 Tax=Streptomyces netropsis TaxID=55404 RepID=A0A7W7LAW5_STRNE|nr:glycosyltransferase family 4 protein [Streptomyces netropsis]MBB4886853.1 glycosyltransferase involved in cell wall biosynthesis [Streptomyces netropsis]GGR23637.1 glycosyl transferase family 1 [Streptomyces netropsis]